MSCSTVRGILYNYINAYVDDELSPTDRAAVEKHFDICAHCANERFQIEQMKHTLHSELSYSTPYGLIDDIKDKLSESIETENEKENKTSEFSWKWLSYVAPPVVSALATILIIIAFVPHIQGNKNIELEIVSAHVRSMMEDNLTHIDTTNPKKVKPWFNTKIDFVPNAKDLENSGFQLIGARLDYINRQNAASIVYKTQNHIINLFIFPTKEKDMEKIAKMQNRGFNIIKWTKNGLEYCAISNLSMVDLEEFAHLYKEPPYRSKLF